MFMLILMIKMIQKDNDIFTTSQGFRFYYHPYYKDNDTTKELLPGGWMEQCNTLINPNYKYKDWLFLQNIHQ